MIMITARNDRWAYRAATSARGEKLRLRKSVIFWPLSICLPEVIPRIFCSFPAAFLKRLLPPSFLSSFLL
jgi:hypothetical protein